MPDTETRLRETSAVRRALMMIEDLEARLAATAQMSRAPVAVVGLSCRFPGGVTGGDGFWRMLSEGRDGITEVPPSRWDLAAYYDPDPDRPGKTNARWGGFLDDVDLFDAGLFGIARREAETMDPQHRLLLEVSWQALEQAGLAPDGLTGSKTGVFVGLSTSDYAALLGAGRDASWIDAYSSLGNAPSISAGRLAYSFGFQGPAMVVDTACSSSLMAVHLAAQALRAGECELALAAGVNLTLSPELTINFTKARMLAADGRCKAFDGAADGYVRGEGCGVIVLKLLSAARSSGDRVLAVIRGSAVNQDGRSAGLTAPNGPSQEAVIRAALANAGLAPDAVDCIEAHGTGTALGDPIEMHALKAVFAGRDRALPVGSVKTNIGHAEAAAGIAGLIKAVLMLRHQAVPASLHFRRLNPHIDLGGVPLTVPTALTAGAVRCVGVSSFGFSGTNAHVVLERATGEAARAEGETARAPGEAARAPGEIAQAPSAALPRVHILPLSARDPTALEALVAAWSRTLSEPGADFAALCHTAGVGRARFAHRLAVVAADTAAARAALASAPRSTAGKPRVAFLCTGQGATHAGMAAGLAETAPVFRAVLARCDAVMGLDRPLAALFADAAALARTAYAQPVLYAVSAGLGALWRSWGIEPAAVLGHSVGEYAAAHLAGVLSLEDGARLIAARGRLMQALPPGGAMAALIGPAAAAAAVLSRHPDVEVAGTNSPTALTVAGPEAAIDRLLADPALSGFMEAGPGGAGPRGGGSAGATSGFGPGERVVGQKLGLRHAFHSRLLEPMLDGLEAAAGTVVHHAARLPVVGNLDGTVVRQHDAAYWRAHARGPVRFSAGLATLAGLGCTHLVELGAQPVLSGFARAVFEAGNPRATGNGAAGNGAAGNGAAGNGIDGTEINGAGANGVGANGARVNGAGANGTRANDAGPHGARVNGARVNGAKMVALPSLQRARPGQDGAMATWTALHEALARLWRDGAPVDWAAHDAPYPLPHAEAPGYPFQRQRYWFQTRPVASPGVIKVGPNACFAGDRVEMATGSMLFRGRLDFDLHPFLRDHVVMGDVIVPGASHIAMMLASAADGGGAFVRDVVFAAPLKLSDAGCNTQIILQDGRITFYADASGAWTLHASATAGTAPAPAETIDRQAIEARCKEDRDGPAKLHAMLETRGITLGPSFQGVRRLFRGENEALVQVALPNSVAPVAPLHPAQLDACFQALGATFQGAGTGGAFLPLAVDQAALHRPFAGPLWAHVRAFGSGGGSADVATGDVTLFDEAGVLIASITGLTIKRVDSAPPDPSERWTYRVAWRPRDHHTLELPAPDTLAVASRSAGLAAAPRDPGTLGVGLERLSTAYAAQALAAVPPDEVAPGQRRLFAHLPTLAAGAEGEPEPQAAALIARYGERMEIALACRAGRALAGVLRGETDPLSVLFGDGSASVYAEPPFARMLNTMVVAALRSMAEATPANRPLRVLEVGAGTGAILAALEEAVPADRIAFTFTDISPAFVASATARFGSRLAHAAVLDIERPPAAQGFKPGSFDIVVAANVLHATCDLRESLRHATGLLAPHGTLLLLEAVRRSNWSDLVFGLTAGWWRFADSGLRPSHPLLPLDKWEAVLGEVFGSVATVASPGAGDQMLAIAAAPRPGRETLIWEAPSGLAPLDLADTALRVTQQALALPDPPALRIVTRNGQMLGAEPMDERCIDQSVLLGLGRVIGIEHPELDCRLVDLPPEAPLSLVSTVPTDAREAGWRDGRWHTPRLTRVALPAEPGFRTSGTHLVTGGLGGLGPLLAGWLLDHGASHVVLMARTERRDVTLPQGTSAIVGDVSRADDVQRVVDGIGADLRGVFHLAGSLSDAALLRLTRDDLALVFAAKVDGARNLNTAVNGLPLDAFVLFGSSVGLIGNPGQGAHAAANAYLAGLAQARRGRGLPGLCVDWGAWGQAGTLTRSDVGARLVASGAVLMPPADALTALGRAIVSREPRFFVAAIDWARFLAGYGDAIPDFFGDVFVPRRTVSTAARVPVAAPRASRAALAGFVAEAAATVLRAAPGEAPPPDAPLNEAGLDSLMALELRKALGDGLDLQLPATLLFNFPTVDALTEHLAGLVGLGEALPEPALPPRPPPAIAPDRIVETVMRMTEDEMAAVIAREFALTVAGHG